MKSPHPPVLWLALIAALAPCSNAFAASAIVTPVVRGGAAVSSAHECVVLNTGTRTVTVTSEVVNALTGALLGTSSGLTSPGTVLINEVVTPPSGITYCRVSGLGRSKARVTHCALNASGTACGPTVTVP